MTVQELQEIMVQRFEALERYMAQPFEAQDSRQDRLEARMDRLEDKPKCWMSPFNTESVHLLCAFGSMQRGLHQRLSLLRHLSRVFFSNQHTRRG